MTAVHYRICDYCGKKLNEMTDYTESEICIAYTDIEADLSIVCLEKLVKLVKEFIDRSKDEYAEEKRSD